MYHQVTFLEIVIIYAIFHTIRYLLDRKARKRQFLIGYIRGKRDVGDAIYHLHYWFSDGEHKSMNLAFLIAQCLRKYGQIKETEIKKAHMKIGDRSWASLPMEEINSII